MRFTGTLHSALGLALYLFLLMSEEYALAGPCVFEPQPVAPFPSPGQWPPPPPPGVGAPPIEFHHWRVRGARKDRPFTITFRSSELAWLHWSRMSVQTAQSPLLRQRLEVDRMGLAATYESYCATDWLPVTNLPLFGRLKLDGNLPAEWRVRIFEENLSPDSTILDEDLAEMAVNGKALTAITVDPAPLPGLDFLRPPSIPALPQCTSPFKEAPADAILIYQADIAAGALNVPGYIHTVSGRNLFLKVLGNGAGPPLKVQFAAKSIGLATPPVPVCTAGIDSKRPADEPQWIVASHPYDYVGSTLRWTIALSSEKPSPALKLQVYRDRNAGQEVANPGKADVYSCTHAYLPPEPERKEFAGPLFRSAYALTIRTGLRELGMQAESFQKVVDAMLTAVTNWRASCARCSPYQFSVIDIDGAVYVPSNMLHGSTENFRATLAQQYPFDNRILIHKSNGYFTDATPMVKVSGTLRQRLRFCNQQPDPQNRFSAPNSPLCRPTVVANADKMIINFEWSKRALPCGAKPGVVACWNGTDRIIMNLNEFSFYAGDIGNVLLGTAQPQVDVTRVFTHEVGHWLGVGHLTSDGNIMSAYFADAQCIDDLAQAKLNNIAVGLETQVRTPEALLYEK